MKTEAEIRRHRDNLMKAVSMPCGCAGTEHEVECILGREMMRGSVVTLAWVLGEPGHDRLVADIAVMVGRSK